MRAGGGVEAVTTTTDEEEEDEEEGGQVTGGLTTRLELLPWTHSVPVAIFRTLHELCSSVGNTDPDPHMQI